LRAKRNLQKERYTTRTRVASIFPNPDSCLRLVSALLTELDDEWMTGKVYLNFNP
ncbi:MAG: transposase, partial [Rhodocyclaceae bacterium]|nr:transposase [Rhodocyclaceae bacterium]